jgi:hypothetical protein
MLSISPEILFGSILPRVEDPLPDTIGLGFPFACAGAGGVLAGVVFSSSSAERRDRAMSRGGLVGFQIGAAVYFLALATQLVFSA